MAYSKNLKQRDKVLRIADVSGSLHRQILEIIMENGFLIKQENWDTSHMEMRAVYDAYRVLNLVEEHLNNDR
jgi:septum formation inhibitor-activating ATPase MinD